MKRPFRFLFLLLLVPGLLRPFPASAQLQRAEYFFDTDPGAGQADSIRISSRRTDTTFQFPAYVASLPSGIHRFYLRVYDSVRSSWSQTIAQLFYLDRTAARTGASIAGAEYFFDADPGFGSGTAVTVGSGTDQTLNFTPSVSALSNGLHRLFVRTRDAFGNWSLTAPQLLYLDRTVARMLPNIASAEYFFDTDPGLGSATAITVGSGPDQTLSFSPTVSALSNGLHRLYIRAQDANGNWSMTASQLLYLDRTVARLKPNIAGAEYFFDTDPGFGNGTAVSGVTPGQDLMINLTPSMAALSANAFHRLYVRTEDASGNWSQTISQQFFIPPPPPPVKAPITALEYFFDTDPGFGSATPVTFTKGLDVTIPLTAAISGLSEGLHRFAVRSQDSLKRWSLTTEQLFYIDRTTARPLPNVIAAEYFVDTDPGISQATTVSVTAGQDVSFGFNPGALTLSNGLHRLYVRSKDASGNWSLSAPQLFYYEPATSRTLANITGAEYFFDTDPGAGQATALAINAPATDLAQAATLPTTGLSTGIHHLFIRTKDASGMWSLTTPQLVYLEAVKTYTPGAISRLEWFWDTDPGFGQGNAIAIPSGQTELQNIMFTAPVAGLAATVHNLFVRANDDWGMTAVKTVDLSGTALPARDLTFRARRHDNRVLTDWALTAEEHLRQYGVERSSDGRIFQTLGTVPAAGATTYSLTDFQPFAGLNYYRLRMDDIDGSVSYSAVVAVLFQPESSFAWELYPNPATGQFQLSGFTPMQQGTVRLFNMANQLVRDYRFQPLMGSFSLADLAGGTYMVEIQTEKETFRKPLLVR